MPTMYLVEELLKVVKNNPFTVTFIKKDGTERKMTCTLDPEANQRHFVSEARGLVPVLENGEHKFVNFNTLIRLEYENNVYTIHNDKWSVT